MRVFGLTLVVLLALCAGFSVGRYTSLLAPHAVADEILFAEPLIEQAVRVQLGKNETEAITSKELLTVREIYIFGNEVSKTEEAFSDGLGGQLQNTPRGEITSLADVRLLPNLEVLYINYQVLSDISPVAELEHLTTVSLRSTYVEDISALAGMKHLGSVVLFDTYVSELSALKGSSGIQTLDIGKTYISSIDDLPELPELTSLSLRLSAFTSLDGVERFARLERLDLCRSQITDLSPLLSLQSLSEVSVDESMRGAAEVLGDTMFEIMVE